MAPIKTDLRSEAVGRRPVFYLEVLSAPPPAILGKADIKKCPLMTSKRTCARHHKCYFQVFSRFLQRLRGKSAFRSKVAFKLPNPEDRRERSQNSQRLFHLEGPLPTRSVHKRGSYMS